MGKMAGCCLPFLFALLLSLSVVAVPITAKIVGVSDGDTVTALDANNVQAKIRMNGIVCVLVAIKGNQTAQQEPFPPLNPGKGLILLVPGEGIEPATSGSTIQIEPL